MKKLHHAQKLGEKSLQPYVQKVTGKKVTGGVTFQKLNRIKTAIKLQCNFSSYSIKKLQQLSVIYNGNCNFYFVHFW